MSEKGGAAQAFCSSVLVGSTAVCLVSACLPMPQNAGSVPWQSVANLSDQGSIVSDIFIVRRSGCLG